MRARSVVAGRLRARPLKRSRLASSWIVLPYSDTRTFFIASAAMLSTSDPPRRSMAANIFANFSLSTSGRFLYVPDFLIFEGISLEP